VTSEQILRAIHVLNKFTRIGVISTMKGFSKTRLLSRRNFFGLMGAGTAGVAYMHFGEPGWLEVNQPRVNLSGASPGAEIRLLHLSDFHAGRGVEVH
jgi:hypothetical protein